MSSLVDMFKAEYSRAYIEQVYLHCNKDAARTTDMFLSRTGLPKSNEETEIEVQVIDTSA